MADSFGNVSLPGPLLAPGIAVAAPQVAIELAQQPPPALMLAATLAAVVVGRGGNGALLLRTDYGTLALKTAISLPPGSRVDLKLLPGPPPAVVLLHVEAPETSPGGAAAPQPAAASAAGSGKAPAPAASAGAEPADTAPTQLALGSDVEATVTAPASDGSQGLALGTRLLLRVSLPEVSMPLPPQASSPSPAGSIAGTVLASPADASGKTLIQTPLGTLTLDQRLALPPGTAVEISTISRLPSAASPTSSATIVPARLIAPPPGNAAPALPVGSRLELRIQALAGTALPPDSDLAGTVVAATAGETMVETAIGTLALQQRLALPPGTALALWQLAAAPPDQPADPPLPTRWSALEQTLAVFDRVLPELAAQLRSDLMPATGQALGGTLLFLLSALNVGTWPGAKTLAALDEAGRHDLRDRLESDIEELRQLGAPSSGDWRVYALPLLDGAAVRPVRLYFRRRSGGAAPDEQGTRFVLEVEMTRMGALQLDGLVRAQRFDLVLRSHRAISPELRQEIAEIFRNAVAASGLAGDVTFTTASRFAVAPLEALAAHIGVTA
ncbi:MAG TPA: hypothetical protein VE397_12095 [Stellaceae bacterium]|jgi:hypothetical protein|nr:hypothetical protein [Stellaceae bacterium]